MEKIESFLGEVLVGSLTGFMLFGSLWFFAASR